MNSNGRYVRVHPRFRPRHQGPPRHDSEREKRHKKIEDDSSDSDSDVSVSEQHHQAPPVQTSKPAAPKISKQPNPTPTVSITPAIPISPPSSSAGSSSHESDKLLSPPVSSSLDSLSPKSEFGAEMERLLELEGKEDEHAHDHHFMDDISDVAKRTYRYGDIVSFDEDQEHEFKAVQIAKRPDENIADYCEKYINAFLNTSGGTIYFGIEDNGRIVGIPMNRAMRDNIRLRIDQTMSAYQPQVDPNLVKIEMIAVVYDPKSRSDRRAEKFSERPSPDSQKSNPREGPKPGYREDSSGTHFDKRGKRRSRERDQKWFAPPKSQQPHSDPNVSREDEKAGTRYVIEVRVWKGLAPVYLQKNGTAYMRLSGSTQKMSADTIKERMEHGRPYRGGGVHAVPRDFIGRRAEIEEIRSYIAQEEEEHAGSKRLAVTAVLWGMPLTGKSTLARRLVLEFSSRFPDLHIQIDLKGGFLSQSNYLDVTDAMITVIKSVYPHKTLPEDRAELKGLYESCFAQKRCIVLIENVGTPEQIRELTPSLATSVLVLVTSRKDLAMAAAELEGKLIRLVALTPEDAAELLIAQCQCVAASIPREQALELVRLCGYMPLPIRILGSALSNKQATAAGMIANLQKDENRRLLVEAPLQTAWDGYTDEMRTQLCQLSLFPSPFGLGGATAVLGAQTRAAAQAVMSQLCSFGLYELDSDSGQYLQNDLLRLFVVNKAQSCPQLKEWMARFVSYHLDVIEQVVLRADVPSALAFFSKERPHIDAVQRYLAVIGNAQLTNSAAALARRFASQLPRRERVLIDKYFVAGAPLPEASGTPTEQRSDKMLIDEITPTTKDKSYVSAPPSPMENATSAPAAASTAPSASVSLTGAYVSANAPAGPAVPQKAQKSHSGSNILAEYGGK